MEDRKQTEKEKQALVKKVISHVGKPSFVDILKEVNDTDVIDAVLLEIVDYAYIEFQYHSRHGCMC